MKSSLIFLLTIGLLSTTACEKEEIDALPKATQSGKNTAGFLLDGQAWLPKTSLLGTGAVRADWLKNYRRNLVINFSRSEDKDAFQTTFRVQLPTVRQTGTYALVQEFNPVVIAGPSPAYAAYDHIRPAPRRSYYTSPQARGTVTLTRFDTIAHIVSGTFEATVREYGGPDSLHITQGRFDLTF